MRCYDLIHFPNYWRFVWEIHRPCDITQCESISQSVKSVHGLRSWFHRVIFLFPPSWMVYLSDRLSFPNPATFRIRIQILRPFTGVSVQHNPGSVRGWILVNVAALLCRGRPVAFCCPALILLCGALFRDHAGVTQGLPSVHACHCVGH